MGYTCPRCGGKASRVPPKGIPCTGLLGLIGLLPKIIVFALTFTFHCRRCVRDFYLSEMPEGTREKALLATVAMGMIIVTSIVLVISALM